MDAAFGWTYEDFLYPNGKWYPMEPEPILVRPPTAASCPSSSVELQLPTAVNCPSSGTMRGQYTQYQPPCYIICSII